MPSKIRFCPNCGSTSVEPDNTRTNKLGEIISNQNQWLCRECDYRGLMPKGQPADFEDKESINFEPKEQPKVDTNLGRAYLKYILYISLPLSILYLLFKLIIS